jgi:hypothetical protein
MPTKYKFCPSCNVAHTQHTKRCENCHKGNVPPKPVKKDPYPKERAAALRTGRCTHDVEYDYDDGVWVCENCGRIRREG